MPDGEAAFAYPVPTSELVPAPERRPFILETPQNGIRSIGTMIQAAPIPESREKHGKIAAGALVLYRPPLPTTPKSVVVGRVIQNMVTEALLRVQRFVGRWQETRVQWKPAEPSQEDFVPYKNVVREVSLQRDGALFYSDLRAVENGHWRLEVPEEPLSPERSYSFNDSTLEKLVESADTKIDEVHEPIENRKERVYVGAVEPAVGVVAPQTAPLRAAQRAAARRSAALERLLWQKRHLGADEDASPGRGGGGRERELAVVCGGEGQGAVHRCNC